MLTFRKISYIAAIAAAGVIGANAASAAVYNFTSTNVTESGVADGTIIVTGGGGLAGVAGYEYDGTDITGKGNFAYLDAGRAGLGACSVLDAMDQCDPGNDDNVTVGEAVGVNFGDGILESVTFRNSTHGLLASGSTFMFSLSGGIGSFFEVIVGAMGVWDPIDFAVSDLSGVFFGYGGSNAAQFYIASANYTGDDPTGGPNPVPLPAGGLLLLTALGGLGVARKRAKKS